MVPWEDPTPDCTTSCLWISGLLGNSHWAEARALLLLPGVSPRMKSQSHSEEGGKGSLGLWKLPDTANRNSSFFRKKLHIFYRSELSFWSHRVVLCLQEGDPRAPHLIRTRLKGTMSPLYTALNTICWQQTRPALSHSVYVVPAFTTPWAV